MSTAVPSDQLIGFRMAADQSFNDRVLESQFSSAEWELIMSVISYEIDDPSDPDDAELVPVLDKLDDALSASRELKAIDPYEGATGGRSGGGILDRLLGALRGDSSQADRRRDAEALVLEYTAFLEGIMRSRSEWESICAAVAPDP